MHSSCYKYKDAAKIMSRLTRAQASSNLPARSMSPIPRRAPAICLISSSNRLTARTRLPSNTSGANANTSAKRCPRAHPAHASISSGLNFSTNSSTLTPSFASAATEPTRRAALRRADKGPCRLSRNLSGVSLRSPQMKQLQSATSWSGDRSAKPPPSSSSASTSSS
eukprot:GHRR01035703.1.p1 GENE.GHRR01035703.1~~GHRR01035703.1.p1  ORF type:complete len:167 (-),score=43.17 GHRR01035703.1:719-1219(-)